MNKTMLTGIAGLALGLTTAVGIGAWSGAPVFDDSLAEERQVGLDINDILAVADFDQDGFDDLLAFWKPQSWGNGRAVVLMNQSGKGFTTVFTSQIIGANWTAADVNGDGYPDLIKETGQPWNDTHVTVLINQLANEKVCATDLDKSGSTEIGDLLFVIEDWGPCQDK